MIDERIEEISQAILPGVIALVVLLFLTGPEHFFGWAFDKITFYLILFFFFKTVASIFVQGRFEKKEIVPLSLGVLFLIPYAFFTGLSPMDILITAVEVIIIVSLFWKFFSSLKERVRG